MNLTPVTCNNCGASLQVPDSAHFVTCRYCNSQLEIKRTDSAISTEVLQRIDHNTAAWPKTSTPSAATPNSNASTANGMPAARTS